MTHIQIAYLTGIVSVALLFALCGYMVGFWRGLGHARKEFERYYQRAR